jgi:hypothetical protein
LSPSPQAPVWEAQKELPSASMRQSTSLFGLGQGDRSTDGIQGGARTLTRPQGVHSKAVSRPTKRHWRSWLTHELQALSPLNATLHSTRIRMRRAIYIPRAAQPTQKSYGQKRGEPNQDHARHTQRRPDKASPGFRQTYHRAQTQEKGTDRVNRSEARRREELADKYKPRQNRREGERDRVYRGRWARWRCGSGGLYPSQLAHRQAPEFWISMEA